jgi:hypothetical protein
MDYSKLFSQFRERFTTSALLTILALQTIKEFPTSTNSCKSMSYQSSLEKSLTVHQGLAISNFWMAIDLMSSAAVNLSGHNIGKPLEKTFCSFNGFNIQLWVVQSMSSICQLFCFC